MRMPVAQSRLEVQQVVKLLQLVRDHESQQIEKLVAGGIPFLVNYNEVHLQNSKFHTFILYILNRWSFLENDFLIDRLQKEE